MEPVVLGDVDEVPAQRPALGGGDEVGDMDHAPAVSEKLLAFPGAVNLSAPWFDEGVGPPNIPAHLLGELHRPADAVADDNFNVWLHLLSFSSMEYTITYLGN